VHDFTRKYKFLNLVVLKKRRKRSKMIKTILGIILLLIPFLLISRFKDKKAGFIYILSLLLGSIFIVSFITQILGIFRYWIVLFVFLAADLVILTKANFKETFNKIKETKINLPLVLFSAAILIILLHLYSVHYNYTGTIATIEGWKETESMKYPYPYFSDEWVSASLMRYSISSGKLPMVNPLWYNIPFPNLSFPFHTFSAGFFLILGLNPIQDFAILPLLSGMLICLLIYFILRANNVGF